MNKSKSRAIRRRSARKIRGGALEILKADYNHIAPVIKPLILAAIISSIMHQTIKESTAMFAKVLSIIAEQLTLKDIELIFPGASITEIKSMIDMLNGGKSISFHQEPATPVIDGGSRRRTKTKYRLRSKTHKHQIQSGGNKKLLFMVVLFISACYFIYMGIIGMTTRPVFLPTDLVTAGELTSQFQSHAFLADPSHNIAHMNELVNKLFDEVKSRHMSLNIPWSTLFNSQEFHDNSFTEIYGSKEIESIIAEITRTLQLITDSVDPKTTSSVDMLTLKANPLVNVLQQIILNKLPKYLADQIKITMIYSAIQLIIGSGLGWLVYGLFSDNGREDDTHAHAQNAQMSEKHPYDRVPPHGMRPSDIRTKRATSPYHHLVTPKPKHFSVAPDPEQILRITDKSDVDTKEEAKKTQRSLDKLRIFWDWNANKHLLHPNQASRKRCGSPPPPLSNYISQFDSGTGTEKRK